MELNVLAKDGRLVWGLNDIANIELYCKNNDNVMLSINIDKYIENRSLQANKFYWGVVVNGVAELTGMSPESTHRFLSISFLKMKRPENEIKKIRQLKLLNNNPESIEDLFFVKSTTKLNVREFYEYLEKCIKLFLEYGGQIDKIDGKNLVELRELYAR
jgi:hypothetical protein